MPNLLHRRASRRLAQLLERKREPVGLADLGLADRLYALFGSREGARSIAEYCQDNLRNLQEIDHRELEGLPGVGRGLAVKMLVLMHLIADHR